MDKELRDLLLKEIANYREEMSLISLCSLLRDDKKVKKILINNEYGIIGNLFYKVRFELDDEILINVCIADIRNDYKGYVFKFTYNTL